MKAYFFYYHPESSYAIHLCRHLILPVFTGILVLLKETLNIFGAEIRVKRMEKLGAQGKDDRKVQIW